MTQTRTFYIVRHGETDWNTEYRWQGQTDIPLNETGRQQARKLADALSVLPLDRAVSSDLIRAHETASLVSAPHGLTVEIDPLWREMFFGSMEGVTWPDITRLHGHVVEGMERDWYGYIFPDGGESRKQLQVRTMTAFRQLLEDGIGQHILIATHGLAIRVLLGGLFAAQLGSAPQIAIVNTSMTIIRATGSELELVQAPAVPHLE
jgi:alpha-ribazole phosphatase